MSKYRFQVKTEHTLMLRNYWVTCDLSGKVTMHITDKGIKTGAERIPFLKTIYQAPFHFDSKKWDSILLSKAQTGRPSRWRRSKTWRSPSSPQIHQKYIYMWNNSYRTPTERWQKTSDFSKGNRRPQATYMQRRGQSKAEPQELCEQRREREISPSSLRSSRLNLHNQLDVPCICGVPERQGIIPKLRRWTLGATVDLGFAFCI